MKVVAVMLVAFKLVSSMNVSPQKQYLLVNVPDMVNMNMNEHMAGFSDVVGLF